MIVVEPLKPYATPDLFDTQFYVSTEKLAPISKPLSVVSLFSGAGGLDLGFEIAGYSTLACVEVDRDCRATLAHNRPEWTLIAGSGTEPGDIRHVPGSEILEAVKRCRGEIDVVTGGPPCQSFSNLGLRRGKSDPKNGDLYEHYLRIIQEILPKAIVFENVEGFQHAQHAEVRSHLLSALELMGYDLQALTLVSADYGDPQIRRRYVVMGSRLGSRPKVPAPSHFESRQAHESFFASSYLFPPEYRPYRTVGDAFSELPHAHRTRSDYRVMGVSDVVRNRMEHIKPGENFKVLPAEMLPKCWSSGRHQGADTFGRLRSDRPAVTIRTSAYNPAKGRYIHPSENRGLSTIEMAKLQNFPDDYRFVCANGRSTLVGIGRMIGNAVPLGMARAIAVALRNSVFADI